MDAQRAGDWRRHDCGQRRPDCDAENDLRETRESVAEEAVIRQVVAVEQQRGDGEDAVTEAIYPDNGERVTHRPQASDILSTSHETCSDSPHRLPIAPVHVVGPEGHPSEAAGGQCGCDIRQQRQRADDAVPNVGVPGQGPDGDTETAAERGGDPTAGRRQRIGRDELRRIDHVRQRGGQRREEEPVDRHDNQR
jgi:hypothetical protein